MAKRKTQRRDKGDGGHGHPRGCRFIDWRDQDWPNKDALKYLCPPDGTPDFHAMTHEFGCPGSPPVTPFKDPLFIPPVKRPAATALQPPPDPCHHQRYAEFEPRVVYELKEQEFLWQFHSDWGRKSYTWGFDGITPGPTFHARYGEPILVRRTNDLPSMLVSKVRFALPSTTTHNHNGHQASESDGDPNDWIGPDDIWDHHYPNFPATRFNPETGRREEDEREKLTTLWYHDHRMDFTAANVYAGLVGFFLRFDDKDAGDEADRSSWQLPSGEYDVPFILHDLMFDQDHQLVFDGFVTHGVIGDRFTVNRIIQPHFKVKRRKYRFRILNGGPSRFYRLYLHVGEHDGRGGERDERFVIISGDGNLQPQPVESKSLYMGVAQRIDVIIDFSKFKEGDQIYLENRLDQHHGHGPSGRMITDPEQIRRHRLMRFDVVGGKVKDPSRIPDFFRPPPPVDLARVKRERTWVFDYDGGIWTVNGLHMDPHRIDAGIDLDSAEIWTYRNDGNNWHHPIHSHLMEWIVLEVNGIPVPPGSVQIAISPKGTQDFQRVFTKCESDGEDYVIGTNVLRGPFCGGMRRDIADLGPRMDVKLFSRWPDFLGKYVIHCHNVVHEDYAMMLRWDVVPPGQGFAGSRPASEVYGVEEPPSHIEPRPAHSMIAHGSRPFDPCGKASAHVSHASSHSHYSHD